MWIATGLAGLAVAAVLGAGSRQAAAQATPAAPLKVPRLIFAQYRYDYQGDPRKKVPFTGVRTATGQSLLTNHPWESVGPWMSYDRAQWHKNQLQLMAAAGVDIALPIYRGDARSRRGFAIKGLDVLSQGLKELRSEGLRPLLSAREYPLIGLCLDLGGLADAYGGPVDLRDPDVQRSLYGMIRDFYTHIPVEFRATIQMPLARLGQDAWRRPPAGDQPLGTAYVVRLINDAAVKGADSAFITAVGDRFEREFGARLVWIGTPAMRERASALDAVSPYPAGVRQAETMDDGWITTGSLGPGYDDSGASFATDIRSRENGNQAVQDFRRLSRNQPDWLILDSWNNYPQGSDFAPSLEYGLLYRDLLRGALYQFKGTADYAATVMRVNLPRVMSSGPIYQVEVAVQNSGTVDWDPLSGITVSYRWFRDDKQIGEPGAATPVAGHVRGETRTYMVGVAGPLVDSKPAAPGNYTLEINLNRRVGDEVVWFEPQDTYPCRVPVVVGNAEAGRPTWIGSTLTAMMRSGAAYPTEVRVRNDGTETWKKGEVSVGYRWRRISTYLKGGSADGDEVVGEGKRVPLEADVTPGRLITVGTDVVAAAADGKPLTPRGIEDDWRYVLEWEVYATDHRLADRGGATLRESVDVLDRDPGPSFLGCSLTSELVAGRAERITVGLRNVGPEIWVKGRDKIAVHWFYYDGTEASWNDDFLPLPDDVPAFSQIKIEVPIDRGLKLPVDTDKKKKPDKNAPKFKTETVIRDAILRDVPVRVPYYFGPMFCVFDFVFDGVNASSGGINRGNDLLVIPVNVYSPTFTPLPVSQFYNVDGISPDIDRNDGSIDGRGNTLPAESLPPYVARPSVGAFGPANNPLYPSGLWSRPLNDFEGSRACFIYPNKNNGIPNMIRCEGQTVAFAGLARTGVHLLALATDENVVGEVTLRYADGSSELKNLSVTHWNEPPKHGERIAFSTPHRHTRTGDDPMTRCYVNHYTLQVDRLKQLVGISLPRSPAIKVLAITLESATLRANPGLGQ